MSEQENQAMEVVAKNEEIKDVSYNKENIAFVIKPLHIDQARRWAKWCDDRGLSKQHNKAFAFAMDILEGKTNEIISANNRLEILESLVKIHDSLIAQIIENSNNQEVPEEISEEERIRMRVREKRAMMAESKKNGGK